MFKNYLRLIRFDKPIGSLLLLWPTCWGLWLAYAGVPKLKVLVAFSLGVFLTRAAGCAINDYADSKFDGQVERTSLRPLVTGAISKRSALLLSFGLSLGACGVAWLCLQPLTLFCAIPALLLLVSYPYFKRFFPVPQAYLGLAFSFGILMAFVEHGGAVPWVGWELFGANLLWVVAYDTIYALVDIVDDRRLGLKTSALTFGRWVIPIIMLCYMGFWSLMCVLGRQCKLGWTYYVGLMVAGWLILHIYFKIINQERDKCFQAFLINNRIGLVIFAGLALHYWLD